MPINWQEPEGWDDDGYEAGPPTRADSHWYTHAVVSLDYPKVKRGPKPMNGQMSISDMDISPENHLLTPLHFGTPGIWAFGHNPYADDAARITIPKSGWWQLGPGVMRYLGDGEEPDEDYPQDEG